jgi:ribA/ribD-fused uncharacterized protein
MNQLQEERARDEELLRATHQQSSAKAATSSSPAPRLVGIELNPGPTDDTTVYITCPPASGCIDCVPSSLPTQTLEQLTHEQQQFRLKLTEIVKLQLQAQQLLCTEDLMDAITELQAVPKGRSVRSALEEVQGSYEEDIAMYTEQLKELQQRIDTMRPASVPSIGVASSCPVVAPKQKLKRKADEESEEDEETVQPMKKIKPIIEKDAEKLSDCESADEFKPILPLRSPLSIEQAAFRDASDSESMSVVPPASRLVGVELNPGPPDDAATVCSTCPPASGCIDCVPSSSAPVRSMARVWTSRPEGLKGAKRSHTEMNTPIPMQRETVNTQLREKKTKRVTWLATDKEQSDALYDPSTACSSPVLKSTDEGDAAHRSDSLTSIRTFSDLMPAAIIKVAATVTVVDHTAEVAWSARVLLPHIAIEPMPCVSLPPLPPIPLRDPPPCSPPSPEPILPLCSLSPTEDYIAENTLPRLWKVEPTPAPRLVGVETNPGPPGCTCPPAAGCDGIRCCQASASKPEGLKGTKRPHADDGEMNEKIKQARLDDKKEEEDSPSTDSVNVDEQSQVYLTPSNLNAALKASTVGTLVHEAGENGCWVDQREVSRILFGSSKLVDSVTQVTGPFRWMPCFSNVHTHLQYREQPIFIDGVSYANSETYFQAMKSHGTVDHSKVLTLLKGDTISPEEAYSIGNFYAIRPDWNEARTGIMRTAIEAKFQRPELRQLLLLTGEYPLVQLKDDAFWGSGKDGRGANTLGVLLTELRTQLRKEEAESNTSLAAAAAAASTPPAPHLVGVETNPGPPNCTCPPAAGCDGIRCCRASASTDAEPISNDSRSRVLPTCAPDACATCPPASGCKGDSTDMCVTYTTVRMMQRTWTPRHEKKWELEQREHLQQLDRGEELTLVQLELLQPLVNQDLAQTNKRIQQIQQRIDTMRHASVPSIAGALSSSAVAPAPQKEQSLRIKRKFVTFEEGEELPDDQPLMEIIPTIEAEAEKLYVVGAIVKERTNPETRQLEYLVKWEDYGSDENTWEDAQKMAKQAKFPVDAWNRRTRHPPDSHLRRRRRSRYSIQPTNATTVPPAMAAAAAASTPPAPRLVGIELNPGPPDNPSPSDVQSFLPAEVFPREEMLKKQTALIEEFMKLPIVKEGMKDFRYSTQNTPVDESYKQFVSVGDSKLLPGLKGIFVSYAGNKRPSEDVSVINLRLL